MDEYRKLEIFNDFIEYLCSIEQEKCVEILKELKVTKSEADGLEFFDTIVDQLPNRYEEE